VIIDALDKLCPNLMITNVICIHSSGLFCFLLVVSFDLTSVVLQALLISSHVALHKDLRLGLLNGRIIHIFTFECLSVLSSEFRLRG